MLYAWVYQALSAADAGLRGQHPLEDGYRQAAGGSTVPRICFRWTGFSQQD